MTDKRSRKQRRVRIKTPSGRRAIHYKPRRKVSSSCSSCPGKSHGVTHARNIAASRRTPSRPYAGVLCSKCMRNTIKDRMVR